MQSGFALRTPTNYLAQKVTEMQERNSKMLLNVSKFGLRTREVATLFMFILLTTPVRRSNRSMH
jgi:hypothetical protein